MKARAPCTGAGDLSEALKALVAHQAGDRNRASKRRSPGGGSRKCPGTRGGVPTVTIVVGLLAFTALFVFLRHRRTQRVIHRSAP